MDFNQIFVLLTVAFLVFALYKELFHTAVTFAICTIALLLVGVLTPSEMLKGLGNQQIIVIFLLILITAGIRTIFGPELFAKLFKPGLSPKAFLLRMMVSVSSISAFLNNTPVVAFMIPYVKDWAEKTGNPASRFLIPLSFATILGGMITVIGTSTNLVLNGLIGEYGLALLQFNDFLYLGVIVTIMGWLYLYFIGYYILPDNKNKMEIIKDNLKEYIVETEVFDGSQLIGKSIKDASLRNLKDLFLVEIVRGDQVISPVSPDMILRSGDILFFSGNTDSIYELIKEDNGLRIHKQDRLVSGGEFNFVEAVVPVGSDLIGKRIKDSDFRNKFNASIIAIHRDGKKVSGKVGETVLSGGDFLLLLSGDDGVVRNNINLFYLSIPKKLTVRRPSWMTWLGIGTFAVLLTGVAGIFPLFTVSIVVLALLVLFGLLTVPKVREELDLNLLIVLVCSLAIGVALEKSGAASIVAGWLMYAGDSWGPVTVLSLLFFVTIFLTSLVTNPAAVSIMFPIAMALAEQMQLSSTPFFVAIAFAASGDFMTPIGYQTNLMVYGPGGYTFKDFVRVGTPLTVIYSAICIGFIAMYYGLA